MHIVYFSPTGGTRKAAYIIGKEIDPQATEIDITDHTRQQNSYELNGEDTLLVAVPVYGGRVPSVAIDRLKRITGHNTPAILVVVYGNRDYDDALLELKTTMESNGFQTVACIACIAEHSIMRVYAKGRPDSDDETILKNFSEQIKTKLVQLKNGESFTEITGARLSQVSRKLLACGALSVTGLFLAKTLPPEDEYDFLPVEEAPATE